MFLWLSAGFADNCGAGISPAQDVVVEPGRRDVRTTNLAESCFSPMPRLDTRPRSLYSPPLGSFPSLTGQGSPVPTRPRRVSVLDGRRNVLIVDPSDETRVVLQTALERRGMQTMAASHAKQGLALARQHHPDLIVLDLEIDPSGPDEVAAPFAEQSRIDHAALVLLGSVRRRQPLSPGEYVTKPYHYAPLIRKIEEILSAKDMETNRAVAVCDSWK